MKIVTNLVRAAIFAAFAFGASALVPATSSEAQAQSGYSNSHRAQHHRAAPRRAVRNRYVAPRRGYRGPVVRHYGPRFRPVYGAPRRCVVRSRVVQTYYGPRVVRQRICR